MLVPLATQSDDYGAATVAALTIRMAMLKTTPERERERERAKERPGDCANICNSTASVCADLGGPPVCVLLCVFSSQPRVEDNTEGPFCSKEAYL